MTTKLKMTIVALMLGGLAAPVHAQEEAASASARLAAPGDEHAWLDPLVGEWTVAMLVYPGPDAAPTEMQGLSASREWVLGRRYVREVLRGGGEPLREGMIGFNRLDGRFELVTADAFEPGQMVYYGRDDASPAGFSLYGESTEAGMGQEPTGRARDLRFEFEIVGPDENVQRIFVTYPGAEEFLFVEQRFTRVE